MVASLTGVHENLRGALAINPCENQMSVVVTSRVASQAASAMIAQVENLMDVVVIGRKENLANVGATGPLANQVVSEMIDQAANPMDVVAIGRKGRLTAAVGISPVPNQRDVVVTSRLVNQRDVAGIGQGVANQKVAVAISRVVSAVIDPVASLTVVEETSRVASLKGVAATSLLVNLIARPTAKTGLGMAASQRHIAGRAVTPFRAAVLVNRPNGLP